MKPIDGSENLAAWQLFTNNPTQLTAQRHRDTAPCRKWRFNFLGAETEAEKRGRHCGGRVTSNESNRTENAKTRKEPKARKRMPNVSGFRADDTARLN
ncbi:MAG: hypothetical protein ABI612_06620 [Betaproteobacteria bacterium]